MQKRYSLGVTFSLFDTSPLFRIDGMDIWFHKTLNTNQNLSLRGIKHFGPNGKSSPIAASWHLNKLWWGCPIPPCECLVRICQRPNPYLAFFPWQLYTLALVDNRADWDKQNLASQWRKVSSFLEKKISQPHLTSQSVKQGCPIWHSCSVSFISGFGGWLIRQQAECPNGEFNGGDFCQQGEWSVHTYRIFCCGELMHSGDKFGAHHKPRIFCC